MASEVEEPEMHCQAPKKAQDAGVTGYPKKRARTRRALLRAGMQALATNGPDSVTVSQITGLAGTAPGTFYNHFASVAELIDEASDSLGQAVAIATEALEAVEHDPAARVAIGTLQLLELAEQDEVAASAFVALAAALPEFRSRVRGIVGRAISDGVRVGRFRVEPGAAPVNAVLGTSMQSMRSRRLGEATAQDQRPVVELVLRLLGLPEDEITVVRRRAEDVVRGATGTLLDA
jgi:AcrR family transcriptional regulator